MSLTGSSCSLLSWNLCTQLPWVPEWKLLELLPVSIIRVEVSWSGAFPGVGVCSVTVLETEGLVGWSPIAVTLISDLRSVLLCLQLQDGETSTQLSLTQSRSVG